MPVKCICEHCGGEYYRPPTVAKRSRFCSGDCQRNHRGIRSRVLTCEHCGKKFTDRADRGVWPRFCCRDCYNEAHNTIQTGKCLQCGKEFDFYVNEKTEDRGGKCCSIECRDKYYRKDHHPTWKGGGFISASRGEKFVWRPGETKAKVYVAERRVIASEHIGRALTQDEVVIRIDSNPKNNNPDNLFICGTHGEFYDIRGGRKSWPTKSNLDTYK